MHIVHRDLKPENLLLEYSNKTFEEGNIVKVIDFGTSVEYNPTEKLKAKLGTAYYIAPEFYTFSYVVIHLSMDKTIMKFSKK
jgi:calcium-dependent protein kinase